jgi:hypothetical protein
VEPIKKNDNLEAFSIVKNLYFWTFYSFSEDKYLKKPNKWSKIESNYCKKKLEDFCLERKISE